MVVACKKILRMLWNGSCDVYVRTTAVNPENGRNESVITAKYEGLPCHLSFSAVETTDYSGEAARIRQAVKLFLAPDAEIPPGSKLVITQNGRSGDYVRSGEPAVYGSHQEIALEAFGGWA